MRVFFIGLSKLVFLALLLFVTFRAGGWWSASRLAVVDQRSQVVEKEVEELRAKRKELADKNRNMTERLSRAERRMQIDQITYDEFTRSLNASSGHILQLKEELNFYRSIVSPANNKSGMQIHDFKIDRSEDSPQSAYSLAVIQALKHDHEVAGEVHIAIEGVQGEEKMLLDMTSLGTDPGEMKFKYFQTFNGLFTLPENFQPIRIKVSLIRHFESGSRSPIKLEQWFPWPAA